MGSDPFAVDAMAKAWMQMQNQFAAAQGVFRQPPGGTAPVGAMQAWEAARKLAEDWLASFLPAGGDAGDDTGIVRATLRRMLDPGQFLAAGGDDVSRTVQELVGGSATGDLAAIEQQVLRATAEWVALQAARGEYQMIVAQAWVRAFARFAESGAGSPGRAADGQRDMLDRWLTIANDEVTASQRGEAFLVVQRKLLRAAADYRLRERALIEQWCDARSIPTRTEVDELHATVQALKREIRSLKRRPDGPHPGTGGPAG